MKLSPTLGKAIEKAEGVGVDRKSLYIRFRYMGVQHKEMFVGLEVNRKNIRFAADKAASVRQDIARGTFDYRKHFPQSKRAARYSTTTARDADSLLVSKVLAEYLAFKQAKLSPSGYDSLKTKSKKFETEFGDRLINTIQPAELELWQLSLMNAGYCSTYINDCVTPARGTFSRAFKNNLIDTNPITRIGNLATPTESDNADPFTRKELDIMANAETRRPGEKAMVCFNPWVGLSVSELIAMSWDDIDFNNWTIKVQRSRVASEYKVPKERYRERVVEILSPGRKWLSEQFERTGHLPPREVTVRQRDNRTLKKIQFRPVWLNTYTGDIIQGDMYVRDRFFYTFLRNCGVRVRGPNQLRHTFASHCLSSYVNINWLVRQMGHRDEQMIRKHYARFIPDDTPLMASEVEEKLGLSTETIAAPKGALRVVK